MMFGKTSSSFTGRAKAVFELNLGDEPKAVVTSVVAHACGKVGDSIRFAGAASFSSKTRRHIFGVVMPVAKNILHDLGLPETNFEISVVNLDIAAVNDIGLEISGFSADVPVLVAILSARLEIPISDEIVFTGHIASSDGDIRMVRGIPAKLTAVEKTKTIRTFVHPEVSKETSLNSYMPAETEKIINTLIKAKSVVRTLAVRDIGDLVPAVFSEDKVILAGLKKGFFKSSISSFSTESAAGRAVTFFIKDNEQRFWKVLEHQMIEGRSEDAKQLLLAFARFHLDQKTYPGKLGIRLFNLIQSLPPEARRKKLDFPLLPLPNCIQLSQLAHETELEDVLVLFKAVTWDKTPQLPMANVEKKQPVDIPIDRSNQQLQSILSEINADALTASVNRRIDNARAAYVMGSVVVGSNDEFNESIVSYYSHLLRHTRWLSDLINLEAAGAEGFALLERAFLKKGGLKGALAEARDGNNGGLRFVFDLMTEQFKMELQEKHVNHVLKTALDPLDWQGKVVLMKALINRLKPNLPSEILAQPVERFASRYEDICKGYVKSMDQVTSLFRSF
jgi:hypothetical protein